MTVTVLEGVVASRAVHFHDVGILDDVPHSWLSLPGFTKRIDIIIITMAFRFLLLALALVGAAAYAPSRGQMQMIIRPAKSAAPAKKASELEPPPTLRSPI
jgi:hypothetical protein